MRGSPSELLNETVLRSELNRAGLRRAEGWLLYESDLPRLLDALNARLISGRRYRRPCPVDTVNSAVRPDENG